MENRISIIFEKNAKYEKIEHHEFPSKKYFFWVVLYDGKNFRQERTEKILS